MKYTPECTREDDGRWLAEVPQLDDVAVYSESQTDAMGGGNLRSLCDVDVDRRPESG